MVPGPVVSGKRDREEALADDLGVRERRRLLEGRGVNVVVLGAVEHAPAGGRDEQAAAELDHRQRDAEELEHVGAEQHRRPPARTSC